MTVQELIDYCKKNNISLDTQIAITAKDDYLLHEERISIGNSPYFGNCSYGRDWEKKNLPLDEDGDIDFEKMPNFLMFYVKG
jgi:hypothetical protein